IVGTDPKTDIALLKIDTNDLTPVPFGDSSKVEVGEFVLAIGNPFALQGTLTTGIISSLGRSIEAPNGRIIENIIQTDAAINPGNSGGPLLNSSGQLIGINTAILGSSGSIGIGFAVPADTVRRITNDLITLGYVRRPYLGISQDAIALREYPWIADALRINSGNSGLMVVQVVGNSPAERAGIREATEQVIIGNYRVPVGGDVILAINDKAVNDWQQLALEIDRYKPGDRVKVTILRSNQRRDIEVVLQEAPRG
ncbi:MAG: trypsin-like peptidase domain-containing protein, partial [Acidobacteria bacterium]|nr:trypsin-like peptidase domain-containing protein [Acidobacteriota bacterium]